jgi:hypothetical protein
VLNPDFAVLGAVLPLAGFASYLRDTLRGKTQPNRVSWSLWATAPLIAFAAELAQHTSLNVSLLTFALGAGPALILAASFACPRAYWAPTRLDLACGAVAVAALIGWAVTRRGDVAIALAITADALAAVPTIRKAWAQPESESIGTYAASGAGSAITLLTISRWRFASFAFPLYVTVVCGAIAALIALPHAHRRPVRRRPGLASRPIRLAAAGAAALALLGAAGFTGYQIRSGATALSRSSRAAPALPVTAATAGAAGRRVRLRHRHGRPTGQLPVVAPYPAPVPPRASTPVPSPSRTRRPSPAPSPRPSPDPRPHPSPSPDPSPYPSPSPDPPPYPSPSPSPSTSPGPSPSPSPSPTATPTPTATPQPTPYPTPTPSASETYPAPTATPTPAHIRSSQ